ncbi:MAG: carboxypeptidase M32 [Planctomycetaceae bacterium]|nr:carboxypeptidase M32 [Planctomycetaceae bacterium]
MAKLDGVYDELVSHLRQTALLKSCASVLSWDEQTYLPPQGGEFRAEQLALLAGMVHEQATAPHIGELLADLEDVEALGGEASPRAANVREARRHYRRATCLPRKLVEELSRVTTLSQQAWVQARKARDFGQFHPWLERVVTLKREEADAVGCGAGIPYDALLDDYEPGMTSAQVAAAFNPLRDQLVELVAAIRDSGRSPQGDILTRSYPVERQKEFSLQAAEAIGFDLSAGRLDIAAHPFCSGIGPGDCRLTTRYDEHHFPGAFFGTLHEAGHGMYEQGLDPQAFGTAAGDSASLGIHESQSRMWENLVGRSRDFWKHFFPVAQRVFPEALGQETLDAFHWAINDVRPSWIRVEADEVTYNLHIMLRFDLERPLISGDLSPGDVPQAWNERFQQYFGMTPPHDALGCLQDVHWSAGLIGYFPTYALGNMYAAQFFESARQELGDLDAQFARGEFRPLLEWLRTNIHRRGLQYRAAKLVELVTGRPLSSEPLLKHLNSRFRPLYGLE